jgi:hypothetical protein
MSLIFFVSLEFNLSKLEVPCTFFCKLFKEEEEEIKMNLYPFFSSSLATFASRQLN